MGRMGGMIMREWSRMGGDERVERLGVGVRGTKLTDAVKN